MRFLRLLKRELGAEAKSWVDDGIVTADQATRILARYGAHLPDGRERSAGYYVLVSLAALFGGLSLLVLVSANWDQIPRAVRMGGLAGLTLFFHALGLRAWTRRAENLASIWFFLGCLAYGTAIFLIAQIYHLGEHYPDGIFWWALGSLPFAVLASSLPVALLTVALSGAWLIAEATESFVPWAWPVLGAGLGYFCLQLRHSKLVFLGLVVSGTFWLEVLVSRWLSGTRHFGPPEELIPLTLGLFVVYHAWGRVWEDRAAGDPWSEYGAVLRLWAVRIGLVLLLVFSFEGPWRELLELRFTHPAFAAGCVVLALGAVGGLSWYGLVRRAGKASRWWAIWGHAAAFTGLVVLATVTGPGQVSWAVPLQVLTNLACIGAGIWLVVVAIEDGLTHYFYAGVGMMLVTALLRYVDLVGDYVGASLLFMVFAGILLGAARFWRRRLEGAAP